MAEIKREVKLSDWGNRKAIRLTKDMLKEVGLNEMDNVVFDVDVMPNKITLAWRNELTPFQKLFADYDGGKPQTEVFWMEPIQLVMKVTYKHY